MSAPLMAQTNVGPVIVAVALIALLGVLMVVAMIRYKIDEVLKFWGALGTLVGLICGSLGGYFFTKEANQQTVEKLQAQKAEIAARTDAVAAEKETVEIALAAAQAREDRAIQHLAALEKAEPDDAVDFRAAISDLRHTLEVPRLHPKIDRLKPKPP